VVIAFQAGDHSPIRISVIFSDSSARSSSTQTWLVMTTTDSEDVETITLKILLSYEACRIAVLTCRGGLELLFANKRKFNFSLPAKFSDPPQPSTINYLIKQLCEREMKDKRKELFIKDDTM